jgi:integrase
MRRLPEKLSRSTRRHYAALLNRVLNLAELAGHIERNPLPRGYLPKPSPRKRFPILYPAEDRALLACSSVPLAYRVLWGFLHREGMRRGEAVTLAWQDLDLENGTVSLDENKTDHPRFWKLGPGVSDALSAWLERRGEPGPAELVFTDEHGRELQIAHLAEMARAQLGAAGLTRPDLHSRGPNKGRFGTHSFRRSFVTRSLALGKGEDWTRQRTGHKSEELLGYRQAAKSLAELDLGEVDPLDEAIPEFSKPKPNAGPASKAGPRVGQNRTVKRKTRSDSLERGSSEPEKPSVPAIV